MSTLLNNSDYKISEDERWLLSFYRSSEISGALFFGKLARNLKGGPIQHDLTKHFADESMHAWLWTETLTKLNQTPLKLNIAYQDQYIAAAGMPANIMEILALTLIFERRVIGQYILHRQSDNIHPIIKQTIETISNDEVWHIEWVSKALEDLKAEYGADHVDKTIKHYQDADREIYKKTIEEHEQRIHFIKKLQR